MKNLLPSFVFLVVGIALGGASVFWMTQPPQKTVTSPPPEISTNSSASPSALPALRREEMMRLTDARKVAFTSNPSLQKDYNHLLQEMDARNADLEASMLKSDPNLSPVITKLRLLREHNGGAQSASVGGPNNKPPAPLTQDELQSLRGARARALQTDPHFAAESQKIAHEMEDFNGRLNAAMLKADPSLATEIPKARTDNTRITASVLPTKN